MTGVELIAVERQRQIDVEGFSAEYDDQHECGELAAAAECYVSFAYDLVSENPRTKIPPFQWPWDDKWWKPSDDPMKNLVRAGALIAAEIDRLHRSSHGDPEES